MPKKRIILDTDMGPDCDDAGALAILHRLCDSNLCELLAIGCTVTDVYAAHTADAINRYYGRAQVPIGRLYGPGFGGPQHCTYSLPVSQQFPHRFKQAEVDDAVAVYRRALAQAEDASITFVTIGMLTNLQNLLASPADAVSPLPGLALFARKVARVVCMAGHFEDPTYAEFNVIADLPAFAACLEQIPVPVDFLPFEAGLPVITGIPLAAQGGTQNPVAQSYRLLCGADGRPSWDLMTVYYAVHGDSPLLQAGCPGWATVDDEGHVCFSADPAGKHRIIRLCAPAEEMAAVLDELLLQPPQPAC